MRKGFPPLHQWHRIKTLAMVFDTTVEEHAFEALGFAQSMEEEERGQHCH